MHRGARKWQEITREASQMEPKRSVAVVLDGLVYSYPRVQSEIAAAIHRYLEISLLKRPRIWPISLRLVNCLHLRGSSRRTSSAHRSVKRPFKLACGPLWWPCRWYFYTTFYYNQAGMVSDIALLVNMFFIFGVLASLGAVLTLPGIAGIVLTIGMSVDANVLIYERIREELHQGRDCVLHLRWVPERTEFPLQQMSTPY